MSVRWKVQIKSFMLAIRENKAFKIVLGRIVINYFGYHEQQASIGGADTL